MKALSNFPTELAISLVIQKLCIDTMGPKCVPEGWELKSIAAEVRKQCMYNRVDPTLCLAQGIAESHFAVNPQARRSRNHKNIFNWLNTDDGKNHSFASYEEGIAQYCRTMAREYLWLNDMDHGLPGWVTLDMMVRHDFCRPKGGRYASALDYVKVVTELSRRIEEILRGERG